MIREIERKPIRYEEYWVARVVADSGVSKKVVNEVKFKTKPTDQEIVDILLDSADGCFISVEHNYKLVDTKNYMVTF